MNPGKRYKRQLEKIISKAKKEGYTIFANFEGYLMVVPTEVFESTEDLKTLRDWDYETVDLDMCGTPVMPRIDGSGNG